MRYWVRFLIFDENQSGTGNHQGREPLGTGLVAFCLHKKPLTQSLMVPSLMVPRRFLRKLPTYDKHDKLEAGDK